MEKEKSPISVQEMIERYNRELMEFREKHAAAHPVSATVPAENQLDVTFPMPDIERDLEAMRVGNQTAAELELEPGEMIVPPGTDSVETVPSDPIQTPTETAATNPSGQDMSLGYLRVAVTTGRGTIPVRNAQVIITRVVDGNELLEQADRTDSSGVTPLFTLPAVSSVYSQSPGNGNPYTYYTVYVRADGFYPIQLKEVPLYGGITSLQPVDLTPVAEGGDPNRETTITEGAPANL